RVDTRRTTLRKDLCPKAAINSGIGRNLDAHVRGHWIKGLILLAWGLVIVHPVDNLLRPHLIGKL
ncbi:MAG: hypothetical protein WA637_00250, partial [Terriglobales bacterium]